MSVNAAPSEHETHVLLRIVFELLEKPHRHEVLGGLHAVPSPVRLVLEVRVRELRDRDHAELDPIEVVGSDTFRHPRELQG